MEYVIAAYTVEFAQFVTFSSVPANSFYLHSSLSNSSLRSFRHLQIQFQCSSDIHCFVTAGWIDSHVSVVSSVRFQTNKKSLSD